MNSFTSFIRRPTGTSQQTTLRPSQEMRRRAGRGRNRSGSGGTPTTERRQTCVGVLRNAMQFGNLMRSSDHEGEAQEGNGALGFFWRCFRQGRRVREAQQGEEDPSSFKEHQTRSVSGTRSRIRNRSKPTSGPMGEQPEEFNSSSYCESGLIPRLDTATGGIGIEASALVTSETPAGTSWESAPSHIEVHDNSRDQVPNHLQHEEIEESNNIPSHTGLTGEEDQEGTIGVEETVAGMAAELQNRFDQQLHEVEESNFYIVAGKDAALTQVRERAKSLSASIESLREQIARSEEEMDLEDAAHVSQRREGMDQIKRLQCEVATLEKLKLGQERDQKLKTVELMSLRFLNRELRRKVNGVTTLIESPAFQQCESLNTLIPERSGSAAGEAYHQEEDKTNELSHASGRSASPQPGNYSAALEESAGSSASTHPVIGSRYLIKRPLGCGAFGEVFEGVDIRFQQPVAIKREEGMAERGSDFRLRLEAEIYRQLNTKESSAFGVPRIRYYEEIEGYGFLVMDLFAISLEEAFRWRRWSFPAVSAFEIGVLLVLQLEFIHCRGIVHRDLKPDNIMFDWKTGMLFIIDYGLSLKYRDMETGKHVTQLQTGAMYGTCRYASRYAHTQLIASRRDDLESLAYIMVELLRGSLPWNTGHWDQTLEMKKKIADGNLCHGLPMQVEEFLHYVRGLAFGEDPDYEYIVCLFRKGMQSLRSTSS